MSVSSTTPNQSCTLESAIKKIQHWRNNKLTYSKRGIPDNIWLMIFQLERQGYTASHLKQIFGLNSAQYHKKHAQLNLRTHSTNSESVSRMPQEVQQDPLAQFSEAIITREPEVIPPLTQAAEKTKQAVKKIKSTEQKPESYLAMTTVIVECIRPDGHSLKIHTTHSHLESLMQTFYNQGTVSA